MTSFNVVNNATTIINNDLILDPWIYGKLYNGSWSPVNKELQTETDINSIDHCFISHIHQDHWDIETIKYFKKDITFHLPKFKFNIIIENQLRKMGFNNINYLEVGVFTKINENYSLAVIPPLNQYGQETEDAIDEDHPIEIDAGVIIKTHHDECNHLFLSDNTPYNLKLYMNLFSHLNIESIFFPYNRFADDFPLCYRYDSKTKKKISLERSLKGENVILRFIKNLKPKVAIPYSSDFQIYSAKEKEFHETHPKEFQEKSLYSKRISKLSNIESFDLNNSNILEFLNGKFKLRKKNIAGKDIIMSERNIFKPDIPNFDNKINLLEISKKAFIFYFDRCEKNNFSVEDFNDWIFIAEIENYGSIIFNISKKCVEFSEMPINKYDNKNCLWLFTKPNIFGGLINKSLNLNNCQIGCFLEWDRKPDIYSKDLYDSLNFLHV